MEALIVGIGLISGIIIGWLVYKITQNKLETELRTQLAIKTEELNSCRSDFNNTQTRLQEELLAHAKTTAQLEASLNLSSEKQALYDKIPSDMRDAFKALSLDTLNELQERLQKRDSRQSEVLGEVKNQLETLTKQSELLANETGRFRMVLKSNQARGRWGEETLRNLVEAAGMTIHCDFIEQAHGEEGKPDMVVNLPGDRHIIIDAKVPDLEFLNTLDQADSEKRAQLLKTHADKLKKMIKELSAREYPKKYNNCLDYVILFLPTESLFSSALEGDSSLICQAINQKIVLATPASLIALLSAVSISWKQFDQSENTQEIAKAAEELYRRTVNFIDYFKDIGINLTKANEAFNKAVGSFEQRLKPSGERMILLGIKNDKELSNPQPIHSIPRIPMTKKLMVNDNLNPEEE